MTAPPIPAFAADLMTARQAEDPYPMYDALREHTPFRAVRTGVRADGSTFEADLWPLMKYDDVYGALKDHESFSSVTGTTADAQSLPLVLISDDPPRHTRFRRLVSKTFIPRRVAELEPWLKETSDSLFDALGPGEAEMVSEYTIPLPVKAIARILGIPGEEYLAFKRWTDALLSFNPSEADAMARMASIQEMVVYFAQMIAARKEHAAADVVSLLVAGDDEGRLEDTEILGFCILLLVAGNETTTNLMGNMINHLAHHPGLFEQLRADRDLVPAAIEEMLRYESPVQTLFRRATRDVTLPSGGVVPEGAGVGIYYGAANRDPDEWGSDAAEFRLDRNLKDHVAFGMGIHYCLGSPLARAEARITVNNLLDRYRAIEPAGPGRRQTAAPIVFGFRELPVRLIE